VRRLAAALLAFAALEAVAGDPARWYLRIDNDAFFDTDRWYSSGLRIARVHARGEHEVEFGLNQEIYGPEAGRYEFGVVDRAPAARLLLYGARHDRSPSRFQTLEVALGVRGPAALGRQVTDLIHRVIAARELVWSRQESNRFDGYVAGARSHRGEWYALHYGAVLGNEVAFAHGGAEMRFGAPGSAAVLRHAATPPGEARGWGGFLGVSVRRVARNEMLRRQYTAFAPELERRRTVVRAGGGIAWSRPGMEFSLALVQESREFEGQRVPHRFGSLTLHADF
jgi:lipid A 3-O-deacylase